ncbi:px serine/threonine kinase (pxk) [Anopheles darlingi]|uniref:PX domain-containing protein n=1 Tax=Anopheles darlingi TaxID=43151 RepID=W5J599_ANODA|nr:px serine/threonine kinase (pxk) [Anopheles darlingi]
MSLRAIQKRDREKLSSTQRQQQQFISGSGVGGANTAMLLAPPPYQDGTTTSTTTTTTMRMTAGAVYAATSADAPIPSVQSIIQNQQNRQQQKHRNSTATDTTQRPSSSPSGSTHIRRRSSSFPALLPSRALQLVGATASRTPLRSTQSESDLRTVHNRRNARGATTGRRAGDSRGSGLHLVGGAGTDSGSSTNNLYLGAKSEVCLKTLAVKNTLPYVVGSTSLTMQPARATEDRHSRCTSITSSSATASTKPRLYESRRNSELLTAGSEFSANGKQPPPPAPAHPGNVRIPIVGYEVMEERARFTIFKLRIENSISHSCWLVLRRYTDFVRLNNKLKGLFPHCNLVLPRKKWFGDNFSSGFIDNRIQGLQTFINTILGDDAMRTCQAVRDFFCLDEPPPSYSESMEESRVIFEAQEERISELRQQLQTKEDLVQALQTKLATEVNRNKILTNVLRNSTEKCAKCAKSIDQQMKESVYR